MPPTLEVLAKVSPARSYPGLFRVKGSLLSLVCPGKGGLRIVFYYCRTYYKAVRVGGEESGGGTREEPGTLTQGAPVFPGSSRLGIEPKTPGWLEQDPTTRQIGGYSLWTLANACPEAPSSFSTCGGSRSSARGRRR